MTLEQIRKALYDRNLSRVADATEYSRAYLSAIRSGRAENPSYQVIKKLSDYLEQKNDQ